MHRLVCQARKKRKPRLAQCSLLLLPMANLTTLASLIKECTSACCDLERGRRLHADAEKKGKLASSLFVGTSLIRMYGKCHSLADAEAIFMDLHDKDVFSWNAVLSAYLENDRPRDALLGFRQFLEEEQVLCPDVVTFTIALRACGTLGEHLDAVVEGEINCVVFGEIGCALHSHVRKKQIAPDAFINDAVVSMYAKCGCNREAIHVLSASQEHSVTSWNSIMAAYLRREEGASALLLYREMRSRGLSPDAHTFLAAVRACSILAEGLGSSMPREIGQALHADARLEDHVSNVYVANALLSMYGKCGDTEAAEDVFSFSPCRDVVSWNTMLSTYLQHLRAQNVLRMFWQMLYEEVHQDMLTFVIALQACGSLADDEDMSIHSVKAAHKIGQAIHAHVRKEERFCSDIFVNNTLIGMYGKCGDISEAENVFQDLHNPDLVSYNAMLSAYVERGKPERGLQLYGELKRNSEDPNQLTYVICLQACGSLADDEDGRFSKLAMSKIGQAFNLEIWKKGLLSDVVVDSALVSMYGKIGAIPEAEAVFNSKLIQRNSVTWNAMISAYVEHGYAEKALELYCKMEVGLLDEITLVCVLQSCSEMSNLCLCEELHFSIVSTGLDITSNTLMNTLVNAYGCCASQRNALAVFSSMSKPDSVSWNAYVAGYAHHGNSLGCFRVFERMRFAGVKADCVTMLFLLYACSHDGKVDEGLECFGLIMACFGPCPDLQHYIAMLDLLGRNGDFQKIEHALLRAEMPMQTDVSVWLCVLGACRTHRNMELGNRAFANAVNLKPDNASAYLLLSNLYVDCCYDEVTDDGWSGQMILQ